MKTVHRMLIDADTGIDDALAILYALKCPDILVEGITTVFGNINVDQATENTLRIVKLADPGYEVPVARGAERPYSRPLGGFSEDVHGANGIGGVELPPSDRKPAGEDAASFIVRKINENPGELTLVTLGRLTNVAHALKRDPGIVGKVKSVVVMGGAVHAPGNVTPVAEANFWGDPEAADLVVQSGLPVTLVGLDVTMKTRITQNHLDLLHRFGSPENRNVIAFMQQSLTHYFRFYQASNRWIGAAPLHDPLTVLVAADPSLVKMQMMKIAVDCGNTRCAGMVVADLRANPSEGSDVRVCVEVDAPRAENLFLSAFL